MIGYLMKFPKKTPKLKIKNIPRATSSPKYLVILLKEMYVYDVISDHC